MTRIETEVYKQAADDLIGLRVIVIDDQERPINNIIVVQPEDLIRIENNLVNHNHDERYVSIESVSTRIREIAEELFATVARQEYRPPTFYVEDDGDFYVEYHEGELVVHDVINIELDSRHITTYNGNFTITGLVTNNDEPLLNRDVLLYNLNDTSEHYFTKTDLHGIITFNLSLNAPIKNYRVSTSGTFTDVEIVYTKYDIKNEVGTIANEQGEATISAVLKNWDNVVEGQTIELLLNDTVIDSDITDENGKVNFDVTVEETTWYELKFTKPNNEEIKKDFGVQCHLQKTYHFKLDGTESYRNINSNALRFIEEDGENVMTGYTGYINEVSWSNNYLWTLECDVKISGKGSGIWLVQNGDTSRDKFDIYIVQVENDGRCQIICHHNGGTVFAINLVDENSEYILFNEYRHVVFKKTSYNTIEVEIDGYIAFTRQSIYLEAIANHCLGITYWTDNHVTYIKNATITYYPLINPVLKNTYHPLLDGTEQLTSIWTRTPIIHDNQLDNFWDFCSGYLTDGWLNTNYWKLEFEIIRNTDSNGDCGCQITKKGITSKDSNRFFIGSQGNFVIHGVGGREFEDGYYNSCAYNSLSEWTKITVEKVGPRILLVTTKTPTCEKTKRLPWPSMPQYEYLTIGPYCWGRSGCRMRNIYAYTSLENI